MAGNVNVRRDGDVPQTQAMLQPGRTEWEPGRIMRALLSWDPFRELSPSYLPNVGEGQQLMTAFDVKDTPEAFIFQADVPGVQEKDLEIQLHGNRLTIRGKRESEQKKQGETYYTYERSFGSFARTFTLPDSADTESVKADLKDGVLNVTVPKKAKEQPRTVAVNKTGSSQSVKS